MDARFSLGSVAERAKARHHHILQIGLARIDHVIDARARAESRSFARLRLVGGGPHHFAVGISGPWSVIKIFAEDPEFPVLVGDSIPYVSNDAIGSDG